MAKKSSSRTATRYRYEVRPIVARPIQWRSFVGSKKATAMKWAKKDQPAFMTDTMAKIGSEQVWRVDDFGVTCVRRRTA